MQLRRSAQFVLYVVVFLACSIPPTQAQDAHANGPVTKVIFDEDTSGVIGVNADPLTMLLQAPNIQVMGVTVVTGDGWLKQETADALKILEMQGRTDIPVYIGAELPLVQSRFTLLRLT